MALLTISRAISSGIQRNVAMSELKHEAKITDLKLQLAAASLVRLDDHSKRLTEARLSHATWLGALSVPEQECFNQSKSDLQAAVSPAPTTT